MNAQDQELLELAAKAAGIPLEFKTLLWTSGEKYPCYADVSSVSECNGDVVIRWNPLTNDGDALRLAVKLKMNLYTCWREIVSEIPSDDDYPSLIVKEDSGNDPYAATRRAIVRAAAEIGKTL